MGLFKYVLSALSTKAQLIASLGFALGGFVGALRLFEIIGLRMTYESTMLAAFLVAVLAVLVFKAVSIFFLVLSDLVLLSSYRVDLALPPEKVYARITRFLAEHNFEGIYLDKYSLGAERSVLSWLEKTFRLNPPMIMFVWRPFVVVRHQKAGKGTRLWLYSDDSPLSRSLAKAMETNIKYF